VEAVTASVRVSAGNEWPDVFVSGGHGDALQEWYLRRSAAGATANRHVRHAPAGSLYGPRQLSTMAVPSQSVVVAPGNVNGRRRSEETSVLGWQPVLANTLEGSRESADREKLRAYNIRVITQAAREAGAAPGQRPINGRRRGFTAVSDPSSLSDEEMEEVSQEPLFPSRPPDPRPSRGDRATRERATSEDPPWPRDQQRGPRQCALLQWKRGTLWEDVHGNTADDTR
jgi:hypothetical protein